MLRYRDGLLAFAFLSVAGVIAVAMIVDPKGFSIRDWQTLLAAFVALGAAGLAYQAAMAKVELDRTTAMRSERRKALGLALRLEYALRLAEHEAGYLRDRIPAIKNTGHEFFVRSDQLRLTEYAPILECWDNLEHFPNWIAERLGSLRTYYYDVANVLTHLGEQEWTISPGERIPDGLRELRNLSSGMTDVAGELRRDVRALIAGLEK